jgi:hypothetical protein
MTRSFDEDMIFSMTLAWVGASIGYDRRSRGHPAWPAARSLRQ